MGKLSLYCFAFLLLTCMHAYIHSLVVYYNRKFWMPTTSVCKCVCVDVDGQRPKRPAWRQPMRVANATTDWDLFESFVSFLSLSLTALSHTSTSSWWWSRDTNQTNGQIRMWPTWRAKSPPSSPSRWPFLPFYTRKTVSRFADAVPHHVTQSCTYSTQ